MKENSKVAVVTGAGTGIGKAVALALLGAGYSVAFAGRRSQPLQDAVKASGAPAARAIAVATDVADPASVRALFARTRGAFGRLDLLFNNAGVGAPPVNLEDLTFEQWKNVVDINLTGAFLCTQEAIKMMKSQDPRGAGSSTTARSQRTRRVRTRPLHVNQACDHRAHQIDIARRSQIRHRVRPDRYRKCTHRPRCTYGAGVPQANGQIAVEPLMDVAHVASAVLYMASLPLDANVQFMTVMATKMPFVGRG
jgi:NADP-dependent 3-hydroxy acid dehydrogenase YdfG